MSKTLQEYLQSLEEERQADIDAFNDKFGDKSFEKFKKLKDRLKNTNQNVDIVYHTKNTDKPTMDKLLYNAENRVTVNDKGEADNDYTLVAENEYYKVLDIHNWQTAVNLGDSTDWCISGRYDEDEGEEEYYGPKLSQAKAYFDAYMDRPYDTYLNAPITNFLFFIPKKGDEKYCLGLTSKEGNFKFWDSYNNQFDVGVIPDTDKFPKFTYKNFKI